jgi:hypothetical protein
VKVRSRGIGGWLACWLHDAADEEELQILRQSRKLERGSEVDPRAGSVVRETRSLGLLRRRIAVVRMVCTELLEERELQLSKAWTNSVE